MSPALPVFNGMCGTPYRTIHQNGAMATSLPLSMFQSILLQSFDFQAMINVSFNCPQAVTEVIILFWDTLLRFSTELQGLPEFASLTSTVSTQILVWVLYVFNASIFFKRNCVRSHFEINPVVRKDKFPHVLKFKIPGHSGGRNSLWSRTVYENLCTILEFVLL